MHVHIGATQSDKSKACGMSRNDPRRKPKMEEQMEELMEEQMDSSKMMSMIAVKQPSGMSDNHHRRRTGKQGLMDGPLRNDAVISIGVDVEGPSGMSDNHHRRRIKKEELMDALRMKDAGISMIGVEGPSDIVEDAVETAIRRSKRDNLFQIIVTVNVTNKPDLARIQTRIGRALGLYFDDQMYSSGTSSWSCVLNPETNGKKRMSIAERARCLSDKMKEQQNVLVVLFDLHKNIDLSKIGISIPSLKDHNNGCKILLTSASREVFSNHVKTDALIRMGINE